MTSRLELASRPPMGWNSWNSFRKGEVNADAIIGIARSIVDNGMAAAGYEYVVIDDHWQAPKRDARGRLVADPERFPGGITAVADAVHALGLKLGIYSVPGSTTCGMFYDRYPGEHLGSLHHERTDAEAFAEWGVDYLKYDWCRAHINDGIAAREAFTLMNDELLRTGRDIVYSISEYGIWKPWTWGRGVANLWRTTDDLHPHWESLKWMVNQNLAISNLSIPGAWNDPDMLQVGNGALTPSESRVHLSVWAMFNAPLMAGNDLRTMTNETLALLTNRDMIAIDQDWGGESGRVHGYWVPTVILSKPMSTGRHALAIVNLGDADVTTDWTNFIASDLLGTFREAWSGSRVDTTSLRNLTVPARDAVLLTPVD